MHDDENQAPPGEPSPLLRKVLARLGQQVLEHRAWRGDDRIHVDRRQIVEVCLALRDDPELCFDLLVDVTAVDYMGQADGFRRPVEIWDRNRGMVRRGPLSRHEVAMPERGPLPRFAVVYHLLSTRFFHRLRLKCRVPEDDPTVPTVTTVWPGANWLERETYDLYGIRFQGHPDLRRIYLDESFVGHPLRKDYGKRDEQPVQPLHGPAANEPRRPH